ncbi:MAG: DEAD/DEAH box helicase [Betaproteobacteria bacterium]|nr:DEAD/DEAH box helicase [Betaproteobacteria bacterium]
MAFSDLGLIPPLLKAVQEQGYTDPTPIQQKAIPAVLEKKDVMGCAQTGTGKTAGFTLPLLQILSPHASTSTSPARHPVRALVLTPTRELAAQVEESVRTYGKYVPLRITVIYGGVDMKPQTKALQAGVEIVVATPGRLLDHLKMKSINLSQVQILVMDEADRMLDMGFLPDIRAILATLPAFRQNLLFSATFSDDIKRLAATFMRDPVMIEVARRNAPADLVTHAAYEVPVTRKHELLAHLVKSRDMKQVLIFVRMKRDAEKLSRQLQRDGFEVAALHGDRSQSERTQALEDFKAGKIRLLVATEVAARGIDIDQLPFVINYELPNTAEDYVHRIGRTGRAGMPGEAISLVSPDEHEYLAAIEKLLKRPIPRLEAPVAEAPRRRTSAEVVHSEVDPEERRSQRAIREAKHSRRPKPAAPDRPITAETKPAPLHGDYPHFDFSKPYEPQSVPKVDTEVAVAVGKGKPQPRKIGALLGGLAKSGK